ncbi:MAG: HEPN domain-containing protein [Sulfurimonas sp.]|nr:HEPN domain-containing protein [Sulfurimonas sp.]
MNETAAKEWLVKAWHHHSSGKLLFEAKHYTDVISIDLHYAIEVTLKAFLAYENKQIIKTHNLLELHSHLLHFIDFNEDEKELLRIATTYHIKGSYPPKDRQLPPREEIKKVLEFSDALLKEVCTHLNISIEEIKAQ